MVVTATSLAPKSNSVGTAMSAARTLVERTPSARVPMPLRSAATSGERELGIGVGYRYPHDDPRGVMPQQYLPDEASAEIVYQAKPIGAERELAERLAKIDAILDKPPRNPDDSGE